MERTDAGPEVDRDARSRAGRAGPTPKLWLFGGLYVVAAALAVFPPLYIWAGRVDGAVLGLPFSIAYLLFDALLVTAVIVGLYLFEKRRGELD